eukprot:sb/3474460/
MELEGKMKNDRSWGGENVQCICDVRGQCPCPKKVDLPENIYAWTADHGPRDSFGRVVDEDLLPPEVSTWMFSPAARNKRVMSLSDLFGDLEDEDEEEYRPQAEQISDIEEEMSGTEEGGGIGKQRKPVRAGKGVSNI